MSPKFCQRQALGAVHKVRHARGGGGGVGGLGVGPGVSVTKCYMGVGVGVGVGGGWGYLADRYVTPIFYFICLVFSLLIERLGQL